MIPDGGQDEQLNKAFNLVRTPHGTVDNVMRIHSLRPPTMIGHVTLYRAILHDDGNTIPAWLQETVGSYVSLLNGCGYSYANHWANAVHLIDNRKKSDFIEKAMQERILTDVFEPDELALMIYAEKLTLYPVNMSRSDVEALRTAGWDDGQILEANQIIGYFAYANRLLNGLGVTTKGDVIGYYQQDIPDQDE